MRWLVVVLVAACGRIAFDARTLGDGSSGDGNFVGRGETYVKASNTGMSDSFGRAVAVSTDGTTLVVGAPGESSAARGIGGSQVDDSEPGAGAVYVFVRAGMSWAQQAYV